ncbi:MAG: YgiQ family radical SAM protein, partial [bacterium]|nr:YgiQ family radical SAM protein [bacterium]
AHYDYWSDKVRRSVLPDSKADILIYGNGERQILEIAARLASDEKIGTMTDIRGTAFMRSKMPEGWVEMDSTELDKPGALVSHPDPYAMEPDCDNQPEAQPGQPELHQLWGNRDKSVIRLPSYEEVTKDPVLYGHASRLMHLETNPGNARALVQRHGNRDVWLNPPPIPLSTKEMDAVFDLPYNRRPHKSYGDAKIPAYDMIKNSINIMRGCFGGCTFCSITEHEGRIIQSRSEDSIIREIENIRDKSLGFTGTISDLGGPTANMYRLACRTREIESACRLPSCVFPKICQNLKTDHTPLIKLYRRARKVKGVKKVFVASGVRYDLAVESPEYVKELITHHVGGYLKIAPEHTEDGPLNKMMKPGIGSFEKFRRMFEKFSRESGKKQYIIPYFIAAHPGTNNTDMLNLALWLKKNKFRPDQVQAFLPSPMATATAMYHSDRNTLRKVTSKARSAEDKVFTPKKKRQRDLHKAFLRYHDKKNWGLLRKTLKEMGREDLVGSAEGCLVPGGHMQQQKNEPIQPQKSRGKGRPSSRNKGPRGAGRKGRSGKKGQE